MSETLEFSPKYPMTFSQKYIVRIPPVMQHVLCSTMVSTMIKIPPVMPYVLDFAR